MEVCLFGPVAVRRGADLIPITGRRPALLVRALALEPRRPVAAAALIDAAWPDGLPANPPKALQTLIVRLRRAAGPALIETGPGGYALGPEVTTDVERVERLMIDAHAEPDPAAQLDILTRVLADSQGAPFADLDDWGSAYAHAARLAERRTALEDSWLALRLEREGPRATLGDLEAAVAREPLREPRWVLLAEALRDVDRVADALGAIGRARRTFAVELGISPGPLLQAMEEDLLLTANPATVDDPARRVERHRDTARVALADGDANLASKELTLALEEARRTDRPAASIVDLLVALSTAQRRTGATSEARDSLEAAADLARMSGDTARLAAVALAGSGDAWQTTLDATASAMPLLQEALAALPAAPTAVRARLLARYAVASSHVESPEALDGVLAEAAEIATIVAGPTTTATVLIAQVNVDQDPRRRAERRRRLQRLLDLADREDEPRWRSAALPSLARLAAQEGDFEGALGLLDEVDAYGEAVNDPVAGVAAGSRAVLHATVTGSHAEVIAAIDLTAQTFTRAMPDPAASAIMRWAQTGVADLVYDRVVTAPSRVMPFARSTMDVLMTAYVAAALGATGRTDEGRKVLHKIGPGIVDALPRDLYWLSVLWALGRAVWELEDRERAAELHECCLPDVDMFVVDGGFFFLGAVAHHAGLGAAVAGRTDAARELLGTASERHERIGSDRWRRGSDAALARLSSGGELNRSGSYPVARRSTRPGRS